MNIEAGRSHLENIAQSEGMDKVTPLHESSAELSSEAKKVEDEARLVNHDNAPTIDMYRTQIAMAIAMGEEGQANELRQKMKEFIEKKSEMTGEVLQKAKLEVIRGLGSATSLGYATNQRDVHDAFYQILEKNQPDILQTNLNLSGLEALGGMLGTKLKTLSIPKENGNGFYELDVVQIPKEINHTNEDIFITNGNLGTVDNRLRIFKISPAYQEKHGLTLKIADINSIYDRPDAKRASQVVN